MNVARIVTRLIGAQGVEGDIGFGAIVASHALEVPDEPPSAVGESDSARVDDELKLLCPRLGAAHQRQRVRPD